VIRLRTLETQIATHTWCGSAWEAWNGARDAHGIAFSFGGTL